MGHMPYHLEKGHYLLLLEATLNEGIEAVVDDDTTTDFAGLARRYSMLAYMRDVVARPCTLGGGEIEDDGVLDWPEFMSNDDVGFRIREIIAQPDVDGALVGGGLHHERLAAIAESQQANGHVGRLPGQRRTNHCQRPRPVPGGIARAQSQRSDSVGPATSKLAALLLLQVPTAVLRGLGHVAVPQRQPSGRRPGDGDLRDSWSQLPGVRPSHPDRQRPRSQRRSAARVAQRWRVLGEPPLCSSSESL